jgi:hypothetical protein
MLRPRISSSPLAPPYPYPYPYLYLDANHLDQVTRAARVAHAVDERIVAEVAPLVVVEEAGVAAAFADVDEAGTRIDQVKVVVDDKPKVIEQAAFSEVVQGVHYLMRSSNPYPSQYQIQVRVRVQVHDEQKSDYSAMESYCMDIE